jgi:2-methylisocitrate lyase-like PEP mutase family enzyme
MRSRRRVPASRGRSGRRDDHVTLDEALAHFRAIAAAVDVPVNADFEGGFAIEPDDVAANGAAAAVTGVAGLSIEDSTGDKDNPLFDSTLDRPRQSLPRAAALRAARGRRRFVA